METKKSYLWEENKRWKVFFLLKTIMGSVEPDTTIVGLIFLSNYHLGLKNGPSALKAKTENYLQERVQGQQQGPRGSSPLPPPPPAPPLTTSSWSPSTNSFLSVSLFSTPSQFLLELGQISSLWSHLSNCQIRGNLGKKLLSARCAGFNWTAHNNRVRRRRYGRGAAEVVSSRTDRLVRRRRSTVGSPGTSTIKGSPLL